MTNPEYCKFCGAESIIDTDKEENRKKSKKLHPKLSIGHLQGEIGSMKTNNDYRLSYRDTLCRICRNTNVIAQEEHKPMTIPYKDKKFIVIPYLLQTIFVNNEYNERQILQLVVKICNKLETIYKKWTRNGINPCKCNHVGKKISIKLGKSSLNCFIIIESSLTGVIFRISYGGKVQCP